LICQYYYENMLHVHVTSCLQSSDPKLINTHTHTTCLNSRFPGKLRLTSCTLNSLPLSILKRDCRNNNLVATTTVFCRPDALPVTQPTLMPVVHTHTHTRLRALFLGLPRWAGTRKVKPIWFYWSKRQWVAVASAGLYAGLHLAPNRLPCQHPTTQFFYSVKALKEYIITYISLFGTRQQRDMYKEANIQLHKHKQCKTLQRTEQKE